MLRVVQPGMMRVLEGASLPEGLATDGANIEAWQPAGQAHGPEGEVAERQRGGTSALDFLHREQDEPEHGFVHFVFRKGLLCHFADDSETGAKAVVALGLVEGV